MDLTEIKNKPWWNYLPENQKDLLEESVLLLKREEKTGDNFHDYAFVVFPAAKAYEGFLKKLFLDLSLIGEEDYTGRHFRIGKSLNPDLPKRLRGRDWVYEGLARFCQSEDLPRLLWDTWKNSRNLIFHWFPGHKNFISFSEAKERVELIIAAIDKSFMECKLDRSDR